MVQKPVWQPSPPHVFVLCADVTNGEQHEAKVDSVARVRFSRPSTFVTQCMISP